MTYIGDVVVDMGLYVAWSYNSIIIYYYIENTEQCIIGFRMVGGIAT